MNSASMERVQGMAFLSDCNGWSFLDHWNSFYGRNTMHTKDRIHFSRRGVAALTDSLERRIVGSRT